MATMPQLNNGDLVDANDWNTHVDQININTTEIGNHQVAIDNLNSRTTNASTGNTQLGSRVTALEGLKLAGSYSGSWTDAANGAGQSISSTGTDSAGHKGVKVTEINVAIGTPVGCSLSSGTFTATYAGTWMFTATAQYAGNNQNMRAIYLSTGNAANSPSGVKYGTIGGVAMDAQATSAIIKLTAGQQVSVYACCWTSGGSVQLWKNQTCGLSAVWIGP